MTDVKKEAYLILMKNKIYQTFDDLSLVSLRLNSLEDVLVQRSQNSMFPDGKAVIHSSS